MSPNRPYLWRLPLISGYPNLLTRFSKNKQVAIFWKFTDRIREMFVFTCVQMCAQRPSVHTGFLPQTIPTLLLEHLSQKLGLTDSAGQQAPGSFPSPSLLLSTRIMGQCCCAQLFTRMHGDLNSDSIFVCQELYQWSYLPFQDQRALKHLPSIMFCSLLFL